MITYIVEDDVVGGYAIGCDEEEMFWRGCSVDVADLALGKQLEIGDVRIDQGCSHQFEIFCIASGTSLVSGVDASRFGLNKEKMKTRTSSYVDLQVLLRNLVISSPQRSSCSEREQIKPAQTWSSTHTGKWPSVASIDCSHKHY